MAGALAGVVLVLGFALGWLVHRAISIHYRRRWLEAVGMLNASSMSEDSSALAVTNAETHTARVGDGRPYVAGKWALEERQDGGTVTFWAIRMGFDDVKLGEAQKRYAGFYKVTRSNAQEAVRGMNGTP